MLWSNSTCRLQSSPRWLYFSSTAPLLQEHKVLISFATFEFSLRCSNFILRWSDINFFNSTGTFSQVVYWCFSRNLFIQRRFWIPLNTVCLSLREKLNRLNCDMEFDHLGCLGSCKQVMAWRMELVTCLLNLRLVQSEKGNKRNAYTSSSMAVDSKRKAKTWSIFEYLSSWMTEKSANAIGVTVLPLP